jgi:hypothetical protein
MTQKVYSSPREFKKWTRETLSETSDEDEEFVQAVDDISGGKGMNRHGIWILTDKRLIRTKNQEKILWLDDLLPAWFKSLVQGIAPERMTDFGVEYNLNRITSAKAVWSANYVKFRSRKKNLGKKIQFDDKENAFDFVEKLREHAPQLETKGEAER